MHAAGSSGERRGYGPGERRRCVGRIQPQLTVNSEIGSRHSLSRAVLDDSLRVPLSPSWATVANRRSRGNIRGDWLHKFSDRRLLAVCGQVVRTCAAKMPVLRSDRLPGHADAGDNRPRGNMTKRINTEVNDIPASKARIKMGEISKMRAIAIGAGSLMIRMRRLNTDKAVALPRGP